MMTIGLKLLIAISVSWLVAQLIKAWFHNGTKNEPWWWKTGGFPSSHTAPASTLTLGIFLIEGFSLLFVMSLVFLVAIVRDAVGVRYATGVNGEVLKKSLGKSNLAKEVIIEKGHTLLQTLAGFLVGVAVALVFFGV